MNRLELDEEAIFHVARNIGSREARDAYLDQVCGKDRGLQERVDALLRVHEQERSFLESPAVDPLPTVTVAGAVLPPESPGTVIGPYKLLEVIGEGGMGTVYMAEQARPVRRKVALKVIKPGMDTHQVIARFEAERQALALMDHPNIARVLDAGATESGRPFFVMELVRGIPITDYCDREHLSIPERLELFVLVCRAVQHAHQKGVIHRDLKPSNILVMMIDGAAVPKVIDFGVAKATGPSLTERSLYTGFSQLIGTPLYMSPEQAELSGVDVDTRSDVYALGVLLYELLTGTTPIDRDTLCKAAYDEVRRLIREQDPPTPSTRLSTLGETLSTVSANRQAESRKLSHAVRGELDWIVMKALEKDRRRRYETANDFAADVMRHLTDKPVEACPPSAVYRFRKFARRNRVALTTAVLVSFALAVGAGLSTWQAVRATRAGALAVKREKEARDSAAESKAVLDFLVKDLLGASQPSEAKGRDPKVSEILANAEKKIDNAFHDQPLVEAGVRHTLSAVYGSLGRYDVARRHASRALELRLALLGPEHADTLSSKSSLAHTLSSQGNYDEALKLCEQTVEIRRRILGPEHPETLDSMDDLAIVLTRQSKLAEARKLSEKALAISRRAQGPEHPQTVRLMVDLAVVASKLGDINQGRTLFEQILEIQRRTLGPEHPNTLRTMGNLANSYNHERKHDEARKLIEQVLETQRLILGPEHPETLRSILFLASILEWLGKLDEPRELIEQVLDTQRRILGPDHPDTLYFDELLGSLSSKTAKV